MPKHQDNVDKVITGSGTRYDKPPQPFLTVTVEADDDIKDHKYAVLDPYATDWLTLFAGTLPKGQLSLCTDVQIHSSTHGLRRTTTSEWSFAQGLEPKPTDKKLQYQWCLKQRLLATLQLAATLNGIPLEVVPKGDPTQTTFHLLLEGQQLATVQLCFHDLLPDEFCIRELKTFAFALATPQS